MKRFAIAVVMPILLLAVCGLAAVHAQGSPQPWRAENALAGSLPLVAGEGPVVAFMPLYQEILPSEYVTVAIEIRDVEKLFAAGVEIHFDPSRLMVVDAQDAVDGIQILPGEFMIPVYEALNEADNGAGTIDFQVMRDPQMSAPPVSGSGTLAIITFQGVGFGASSIHLDRVIMSAPGAVPIKAAVGDDAAVRVINPGELDNLKKLFMPTLLRNS